jgi:hypothetical protein
MQKELENYIKSTLSAIKSGLENSGFKLDKNVEFDVAVINTAEGGGGLKIYVAKAEGKLKSEEINHIKFEVYPEDAKKVNINKPRRSWKDSCV